MQFTADQNGDVLTTGYFGSTVDFDPGSSVNNLVANGGARDVFIQKLDANGNYLWAKSLGGANVNDEGSSIAVDINHNVLVTGYFKGTVDFDPGSATYFLTTPGIISPTDDAFILKLNVQGNFVWAIQIGGRRTRLRHWHYNRCIREFLEVYEYQSANEEYKARIDSLALLKMAQNNPMIEAFEARGRCCLG